ncbi:MAG: hypothetical protein BWY84_00653 [Candidatus Aerophobetes bacterium ADurb.Bin490]|nr:MAG: hypothetical protein BWY84_00653 [Candidatus Aerophobetes bacterium ADurb.Bin490]
MNIIAITAYTILAAPFSKNAYMYNNGMNNKRWPARKLGLPSVEEALRSKFVDHGIKSIPAD